jgi:hypothetical protein
MTTTPRSDIPAKDNACVIFDTGQGLWVPCGSNMTLKGWMDAGVEA